METYRLAVCEDEDRVRKDLCSLCGEILAEEGIAYEITEFASAGELEKKLEERSDLYDLLLLDICMDSMTGWSWHARFGSGEIMWTLSL